MERKTKTKTLFYESHDKIPTLKVWRKMGRPKIFLQEYKSSNNITVWSEHGYGGIRLQVGDEIAEGKDIVGIGDYVVFSEYYDGVVETYKPYKLVETE